MIAAVAAAKMSKTFNSWDSLVVTHPTTSQSAVGLSTGDRTGTSIFWLLWSNAKEGCGMVGYVVLLACCQVLGGDGLR